MIVCNNQLTSEQLQAVEKLALLCREVEGGAPPLYPHILEQKRVTDNNFLYFHKKTLVGFLSSFFFYPTACEVSLFVAPSYRRQGIATHLIKMAMPLFKARQMEEVIFSAAAGVNDSWFTKLGFLYDNSEYQMERHGYEPILLTKQVLVIKKATTKDISALCLMDELCFANAQDETVNRISTILKDNGYTVFVAFHENQPVGKAHLRWQGNQVTLSDIAILPQFQGQGWGSELLAHCINHALIHGKTRLILDVETSNTHALKLYTNYDFDIVNAIDYWKINLAKLQSLLK